MTASLDNDKDFQAVKTLLENKEYAFDRLVNAMGDMVSIHDVNMRIVFQNDGMKRLFGEHIGEFCYKYYEKKEDKCEGCPMVLAYKDGNPHQAIRIGMLADGTSRRFENLATTLKDKQGRIVGGIEVVRDVEDREYAKEELQKKLHELSSANQQLAAKEKALSASRDELKTKISDLERFNKIMIDRELDMIRLKKEVNSLLSELNRETKYKA